MALTPPLLLFLQSDKKYSLIFPEIWRSISSPTFFSALSLFSALFVPVLFTVEFVLKESLSMLFLRAYRLLRRGQNTVSPSPCAHAWIGSYHSQIERLCLPWVHIIRVVVFLFSGLSESLSLPLHRSSTRQVGQLFMTHLTRSFHETHWDILSFILL